MQVQVEDPARIITLLNQIHLPPFPLSFPRIATAMSTSMSPVRTCRPASATDSASARMTSTSAAASGTGAMTQAMEVARQHFYRVSLVMQQVMLRLYRSRRLLLWGSFFLIRSGLGFGSGLLGG